MTKIRRLMEERRKEKLRKRGKWKSVVEERVTKRRRLMEERRRERLREGG